MPLHANGSDKFARVTEDLPSTERSIFREEALLHYTQNQEKVILPHFVTPHAFVYLWAIAGFILVVGLLLVFWPWLDSLMLRAI